MSHRSRFAFSAVAALALAVAVAPSGAAGSHTFSGGGTRSGGGGHVSSGGSRGSGGSSHSFSRGGGGSFRSSGHTMTPAPPRGSNPGYRGGGWTRGGHPGGGWYGNHWYGHGYYWGSHYHGWSPNMYWGWWPFYCGVGWWWGSPWYWSPWWGYPAYYADVYSWRESGWPSRFGRVKTDVEPDEAEVYLNDKYIGTADDFDGYPDYLYFEPGSFKLEFRLNGYKGFTTDVTIRRGETVRIDRRLDKEPGQPKLAFLPESKGVPMGRFFGKDGNPISPYPVRTRSRTEPGEAPRTDVRGGSGGDEDEEEVETPRASAPAPDTSARGRLRWTITPDDAAVWVDDEYLGTGEELSARPRGIVMKPGHHTVTVVRPGYRSRTLEVEVAAGESKDVVVELER